MASKGFPVEKEIFLEVVEQCITKIGKADFFPNGKPGRGWYDCFRKRHKDVTFRKSPVPELPVRKFKAQRYVEKFSAVSSAQWREAKEERLKKAQDLLRARAKAEKIPLEKREQKEKDREQKKKEREEKLKSKKLKSKIAKKGKFLKNNLRIQDTTTSSEQ